MKRHALGLPDGRTLAWREYGDPTGRAVLYCHGFPGSGAEAAFTDEVARSVGVRVLAPDRPGFGASTPAPARTLDTWVADARALLDAEAIEATPVIGISGGCPYALACAALAPARFPRVATFGGLGHLVTPGDEAGMAPLSRLSIRLARRYPRAQAGLFSVLAALIRRWPSALFRIMSAGQCEADAALFRETVMRERWIRSMHESVAQGAGAAITELQLYVDHWPFAPERVEVPVELWHGVADTVVPVRHGERLAAALPRCDANFLPDEGHFSTPVGWLEPALKRMTGD